MNPPRRILKQAEQWPFRCAAPSDAPPPVPQAPKLPTAPAAQAPAPPAQAPPSVAPAPSAGQPAASGGKPLTPNSSYSNQPNTSGSGLFMPLSEMAEAGNHLHNDYISVPKSGGGAPGGGGGGMPGSPSPTGGPSSPVSYQPNAGVDQWTPQVEEALRRNNLPTTPDYVDRVKKQMQSESSGNPNAINNIDSNAIAGHPSQGLMQTIPGTFNTYRLPGDSSSITDPQANLDAAINYAIHTYGPTMQNSSGGGIGSGHGY